MLHVSVPTLATYRVTWSYRGTSPRVIHQQLQKSTFWRRSPALSKGSLKEDMKKQNHPPKQTYLKMHGNNGFGPVRNKKLGCRPIKACFPEAFSPVTHPHCPRPGKTWPVVPPTLPSSEGAAASSRGRNPGPSSPSHQFAQIHYQPTNLRDHLVLSNLVGQVVQVKVMTGWQRGTAEGGERTKDGTNTY